MSEWAREVTSVRLGVSLPQGPEVMKILYNFYFGYLQSKKNTNFLFQQMRTNISDCCQVLAKYRVAFIETADGY